MYSKRLKCRKCGKTLCTGYAKNLVSVTCTCGAETFVNHKDTWEAERAKGRHEKYKD